MEGHTSHNANFIKISLLFPQLSKGKNVPITCTLNTYVLVDNSVDKSLKKEFY